MRTIIDGLAFAKAVAHVSKTLIAGQRQAVRLAATGDGLRLDADGRYYSRADLDAETVEDGSAVVNGFWLFSVAAVMPSEELNVETADSKLRLDCRGIVMELPLIDDPAAEPNVPDLPEEWASIADGGLARAVGAVVHAADKGSNNPVLSAVRVRGSDGSIELSATNRYVAATARADGSADMDALVPAAWLKANAEGADRIGATGRMFAIAGPVYTDATPMVEGQAPVLAAIAVIQLGHRGRPVVLRTTCVALLPLLVGVLCHLALCRTAYTLGLDSAELLEAARRVKAVKFSGGETVTLALAVGDDSITLGLDDAESGSGARQTVSAEVSGPVVDGHVEGAGRSLRLDARYVANACGALYGDRVTMYVAPRSNGRYKPVLLACPDAPDGFDMRDEQLIVPILL